MDRKIENKKTEQEEEFHEQRKKDRKRAEMDRKIKNEKNRARRWVSFAAKEG